MLPASKEYPGGLGLRSFEAAQYPVTIQEWVDVMGEEKLPEALKLTWKDHRKDPITDVAMENVDGSPGEVQEFLKVLNKKSKLLGCTYDLPTDPQLHYLIRADVAGNNQDPY
jgi:formylglycine-generating enzyme required for sulfatase activity